MCRIEEVWKFSGGGRESGISLSNKQNLGGNERLQGLVLLLVTL